MTSSINFGCKKDEGNFNFFNLKKGAGKIMIGLITLVVC